MGFPLNTLLYAGIAVLINLYNDQFTETDKVNFFQEKHSDNTLFPPKTTEYDFIIVGGGTAGCVVANKLSEKFSVLLIERGGDQLPPTFVPSAFLYLRENRATSYEWTSVKQEKACLITDGYCYLQQGRGLGGSSSINAMMYNRGHPMDYDRWGKIMQDDGWSYENLLPHFKENEQFIDDPNDHLGQNGNLRITNKKTVLSEEEIIWSDVWKAAGKELGYEAFENSNAPQTIGFGVYSQTIFEGQRVSSNAAFLQPVIDRKNLVVSRYSKGMQVVFDDDKKATGVLYEKHGIMQYAKAKREVIISSGTMNSAWILMNSGIGPQEQLEAAGIPVVANLPVGQNWQDHIIVFVDAKPNKQNYQNLSDADIENYIENKKGPLTNNVGANSQAFIVTKTSESSGHDPNWADVQLLIQFMTNEIYPEGEDMFNVQVSLALTESVGKITLNETDPKEDLVWDPRYLHDDKDLNAFVDGIEMVSKVFKTKAWEEYDIKMDMNNIPACQNIEFDSRAFWECFARQNSRTLWHPVGSCRAGTVDDPKAIVDSRLRVHGVSGLRVIDNSIIPAVPNGNTQAPAYVIGNKGASLVLEDNN